MFFAHSNVKSYHLACAAAASGRMLSQMMLSLSFDGQQWKGKNINFALVKLAPGQVV